MKITRVEPILLDLPFEFDGPKVMQLLLLRVDTDAGLTGWGEAFALKGASTTREAIASLIAPNAVGGDPTDIASIVGPIERLYHNVGRNGPLIYGISALDIALWDIQAQIAGKPLYQLLGAKPARGVRAYASLFRIHDDERVARESARAIEQGYTEVKLHEITPGAVAAARRAVGDDTPLMVDTNTPWGADNIVAKARQFIPYNIKWLEEPIWPPEDYDAYADLRANGGVPVAAGENAGMLGLNQMMSQQLVDYIQPSITKIGGFTAMLQIVRKARQLNVKLGPHSPYIGPGLVAMMHTIAAVIPEAACEHRFGHLAASPFTEPLQLVNGDLLLPEGPGLGVQVDPRFIEKYRVA